MGDNFYFTENINLLLFKFSTLTKKKKKKSMENVALNIARFFHQGIGGLFYFIISYIYFFKK